MKIKMRLLSALLAGVLVWSTTACQVVMKPGPQDGIENTTQDSGSSGSPGEVPGNRPNGEPGTTRPNQDPDQDPGFNPGMNPGDAHEHEYGDWVITVEPSCTAKGEQVKTCACGEKITSTIRANGHTSVYLDAVPPTCTETGLTRGQECSTCGHVFTQQELVEMVGHRVENWIVDVEPAFGVDGSRHGACADCGETLYEAVEMLASEGLSFDWNDDGYAVSGIGSCTDTTIVIPSTYEGRPVTRIYGGAFSWNQNITSVFIPNSVSDVHGNPFAGCRNLTSVTVAESNEYLCAVDGILYDKSLSRLICCLGYITEVSIPDSVTQLADNAFTDQEALTEIFIPAGVSYIASSVFRGCDALAAIVVDENNPYYCSIDGVLYDKSVSTLVCCPMQKTSVTIPDSVISLTSYAFEGCENLREIQIPGSVKSIGWNAFTECRNLTHVVIPDSVETIEGSVFQNCNNLISVVLPSQISYIPASLFLNCGSLSQITIPDSVERIESQAFYGCSALTTVTIPAGVTEIYYEAFYGCQSLIEVINLSALNIAAGSSDYGYAGYYARTVHSGESQLVNVDGYVFYADEAGAYLMGYTGSETNLVLPEDFNGSTYRIHSRAFYNNQTINSVVLSDGVTDIGEYAFAYCSNLFSVTLGTQVASIGEGAFESCYRLVEVINHSALSIGAGGWNHGQIAAHAREVHTEESKLMWGGDYVFYPYNGSDYLIGYVGTDTELILPADCNGNDYELGSYTFYNRQDITTVVISDGVRQIGPQAFANCTSLTSVTFGESVFYINDSAFSGCGITSVTIPGNVKTIGYGAFRDCSYLTNVRISEGVEQISSRAFAYCSALTEFYIPASVTYIESNFLQGCTSLTSITASNDNGYYCIVDGILYTKDMTTVIMAFAPNSDVVLPEGVLTIGQGAFRECRTLTSIILPSTLQRIEAQAFEYCASLGSIIIPDGVTYIGWNAFSNCTSLTEVVLPDSVTSIGSNAFSTCSSLTTVTLPGGITSIEYWTFGDCRSLTSVIIPDGVTYIYEYAFYNCANLTSVIIPDGVTHIYEYAFYSCANLTSVTIPNSVTFIGSEVFAECYGLAEIHYLGTEDEWNVIEKNFTWNANSGAFTVYYEPIPHVHTVIGMDNLAGSSDSEYPFNLSDGILTSTNKAHSSIGSYTLTALCDFTLHLQYWVSSESGYDNLVIYRNGSELVRASGLFEEWADKKISMKAGDTLTITYTKDGSVSHGEDCAYVRLLMSVTDEWLATAQPLCTGDICCADCGEILVAGLGGHTEVIDEAVAPSCTETGLTEGKHCSVCGDILIPQEEIPSLGHEVESWTVDAEPALGVDGSRHGYCPVCGETVYETIDMLYSEGLYFDWNGDCYTVVGMGDCTDTTVVIPPVYDGYPVTAIGDSAFQQNTQIEKVILPNSIVRIEGSAFWRCSALKEILLPDSVTYIGTMAFNWCEGLSELTLPNSVTFLGGSAFNGCSALTEIVIPAGVQTMGSNPFSQCSNLRTITVDAENPNYCDVNGVLYNKDVTELIAYPGGAEQFDVAETVTSISSSAFEGCVNLVVFTVPENVSRIPFAVLRNCENLKEINIHANVTFISSYILQSCYALTDINYAGSEEQWNSIDKDYEWRSDTGSFTMYFNYDINHTHSFNIMNPCTDEHICTICNKTIAAATGHQVTEWIVDAEPALGVDGSRHGSCTVCGATAYESIDMLYSEGLVFCWSGSDYAVCGIGSCMDTTIAIPPMADGYPVTAIYFNAFEGNQNITSVIIPDGVTLIGWAAFYNCTSLTEVVLPDSVTWIDSNAFSNCTSLTEVVLPDGLTHIGSSAFYNCSSLTEVTIPDVITSIESLTFGCCNSLTSVIIPDGVTHINDYAFLNCGNLTSVTIPNSVTFIGYCAFADCSALTEIHYLDTEDEWNAISKDSSWNSNSGALTIYYHHVHEVIGVENLTGFSDSEYPFTLSGGVLTSTNKEHSSTGSYTLTALCDFTLHLQYWVSSEGGYDHLVIYRNGYELVRASGESADWMERNISLKTGDTIAITYTKDGSASHGEDCAIVRLLMSVTDEWLAGQQPTDEDICCTKCGEVIIAGLGASA